MTTEELLQQIEAAQRRQQAAEAYANGIAFIDDIDWGRVNRAIADKWGRPIMLYVKKRAWQIHDQRVVTNHQEGL